MNFRTLILGLWASLLALHAAAALQQVGKWHMYPANYNYYFWNNQGCMIFVKGYQSNITISAWLSPAKQWVRTVPETQNTSTAIVFVTDNFKTVFIQTKVGILNNVQAYAAASTLTLLHSGGLSPEAGEVGPPHCAVVDNQLFIAQRTTLAGQVLAGLVTGQLKWKTRAFVDTWGGGTPHATPVQCSPHGKYLAVERAYDTLNWHGTLDVYKTGTTLKKMGDAAFASTISWLPGANDKFMQYCSDLGPPSVWEAARIGSLTPVCSIPTSSYAMWRVAAKGQGSVALYANAKTLTVRSATKLFGPFPLTDAQPGESLYMLYFDGKTVVFAFIGIADTKLRAYRVTAHGLILSAGPVTSASPLYSHATKGFFAFSDMSGTFKVFTPKLKLVGQAVGGPPFCKDRAVLLPDFSASPHEFTIYRW